jgi:hypothetical protein
MPVATTDPQSVTKSAGRLQHAFDRVCGTGRELRRAACWRRSSLATLERFPAKWAPVREKKTRRREQLKPPFRRWRKRSGGPTSPALRHLRELEIENHPPRTLGQNVRTGSHVSEDPLAKESPFLRQDFGCSVGSPSKPSARLRGTSPWIRSPYALTLAAPLRAVRTMASNGEVSDGVCAGPISTAIVRYLPASPGSCQRVEEPQ